MTVVVILVAFVIAATTDRRAWAFAVATAVVLTAPAPGLSAAAVFGVAWAIRRLSRRRSEPPDEALVADVIALGLNAGLSFPAAAGAAAESVPGETASNLMRSIRQRYDASHDPNEDSGLYVVARRALATGAPLLPAVSGYASSLRGEERARRLAAARRLPVKLLFPLALLILPGFLLLTVGPAILGSLERLGL
ncbi:MAG: hypothetical protein ABFS21_08650 [Actinomycetota bacterium]